MRREGRQHGLVMTVDSAAACLQPHRRPGLVLDFSDSPPTTGFRTRVPAKPSNHSKYTGRPAGGCRQHPQSKSRDKSKGARKVRGLDVGLNPRLASWRVAGGAAACRLAVGGSASAAAVYLSGYPLEGWEGSRWDGLYDDERKWVEEDVEEEDRQMEEVGGGEMVTEVVEEEEIGEEGGGGEMEREGPEDGGGDEEDDDDDDDMGFCEVWAVWDYVDEEDWCVVGEMDI